MMLTIIKILAANKPLLKNRKDPRKHPKPGYDEKQPTDR